ncbi:MAG: 4-(cytidine 5'-diphospho)-2-C-methyl-D-erythritol kinase [Solirubrobacteraceae bacterium]
MSEGSAQGIPARRGSAPVRALCALAPAKVNLGLFVGPTTAGGRHELVSVMQSISLADSITLEPAGEGATADALHCPGVPGEPAQNIAARALSGFRAVMGWHVPPLQITIDKRVPVAAGLGGGSGDAAAVLRLAARAAGVRADTAELSELAANLGSDVPAQVRPGRWLALGAGERLRELGAPAPSLGIAVLPVAERLSTAAVYAQADRMAATRSAAELDDIRRTIEAADQAADPATLPDPELLVNDLEAPARALCPAIDAALEEMRATGADRVFVSGSGPTVIGLFGGALGRERAARAAERLCGAQQNAVSQDGCPLPSATVPVAAAYGEPREVTPCSAGNHPAESTDCHNGASGA